MGILGVMVDHAEEVVLTSPIPIVGEYAGGHRNSRRRS